MHVKAGNKEGVKTFCAQVKSDFAKHKDAEKIAEALDEMAGQTTSPVVGETMDLKFTALDGKEVDLAKLKGKVVLVDFWATWCGPCMMELPNVKKAYAQYHDKGFEILGVSLDSDKEKLEATLKAKEMTWAQCFDGKGWKNDVAKKFGIRSIPATFLIGKDGKIAAVGLRGDALISTVGEQLGK